MVSLILAGSRKSILKNIDFSVWIESYVIWLFVTEEKGAELETQIANEEEALNLELKKKEAEKKKEKAVDMRLCNGEIFWIKSVSF